MDVNCHVAVVDLGFGDAGKGTVVDWLCATRPVPAVIRFNGGAQAGHTVVTEDGRTHTFAQFGAGTLRGVPTVLSRFVVVDPLALTAEADHLSSLGVPDPYRLLSVDEAALVATPYHRLVNQARELARGAARHGSCGMGVGETVAHCLQRPSDAVRVSDLASPVALRRKLERLRAWLRAELASLAVAEPAPAPSPADCAEVFGLVGQRLTIVDQSYVDGVLAGGPCVFEGAQGVLLDEWRGFHPYTTWSTTTFDNVEALLAGDRWRGLTRLGVVRCFTTRHGAGPMVTEDPALDLVDPHNRTGPWQGAFRVGHFDAVAHRYAIEVAGGVDGVALTHLDVARRTPRLRICEAYRYRRGVRVPRDEERERTGSSWHRRGVRVPRDEERERTGSSWHRDDLVARLEPGPWHDLDHQAAMTAHLFQARPHLEPEPPADWVGAVASALDAPVVLTSHGPSGRDKSPVAVVRRLAA
jgi:adenylosuccinate synthase